jgi:hypothetical protein
MGEDSDVCVVSFKVKDRSPAKDLMEFIEKGYDFVLDADISSGEDNNGEYSVFVELSRSNQLAEQIKDLTYGVRRLTGIDDWEYRYHKGNQTYNLTTESLEQIVPASSREYDGMMNRVRTEEVKRFFTKTLMDDLTIDGDVITIHKPYNQKVRMKLVREGEQELIHENTSALALDNIAMGEIFWLTKVLGDYNINKIGDGFVFENNGKAMILQRMDL